ncbi:MAG: hypothetical protein MZV65_28025 [Chromatiales bacterium]|nr:hypothetical protein [Chromatiales bacterium]
MKVYLTFDVEIWCNGWGRLDAEFPAAFERYVYGRSRHGEYALPKTLEILDQHGLHGIFFVEPLFAMRFGVEYLKHIIDIIQSAGQEVQLHLHPEWTDESPEPIIKKLRQKATAPLAVSGRRADGAHRPWRTVDSKRPVW